MRTIKIENIEYEEYEEIADALYSIIPYAVFESQYRRGPKLAIIQFWDSDYIPECLKGFVMTKPTAPEVMDKLEKRMADAVEAILKRQGKNITNTLETVGVIAGSEACGTCSKRGVCKKLFSDKKFLLEEALKNKIIEHASLKKSPTIFQMLAERARETALKHGFDSPSEDDWSNPERKDVFPRALALIHSEVSEALEYYRNNDRLEFFKELADVVIRVLDVAGAFKAVDLGLFIQQKMEENEARPYKHGGKKI